MLVAGDCLTEEEDVAKICARVRVEAESVAAKTYAKVMRQAAAEEAERQSDRRDGQGVKEQGTQPEPFSDSMPRLVLNTVKVPALLAHTPRRAPACNSPAPTSHAGAQCKPFTD